MKVCLPHMGPYSTFLADELRREFNWDVLKPIPPRQPSIDTGGRYMNELMCYPAKVTLGTFIEACEQGAQKLLMFDSCGQCRLKTYWLLQETALRKLGFDASVYPVRMGRLTPHDLVKVDPRIPYWKACLAFLKVLSKVRTLDAELWGDTPKNGQVRLGLVGEIFTMLEPGVNHNLIQRLRSMGAYVHVSLPLSYFVFKGLYERGWMKRPHMDPAALRKARAMSEQYFPMSFGGHGKESIMHTLYYGETHYDGVIHVLPFPCMPESTVATVLDDISHKYNMPLMRLIFDAHSGEAGLITRLEAFVDVLEMKRQKSSRGGKDGPH